MKTTLIVAVALAVGVSAAPQFGRPTSRPSWQGPGDDDEKLEECGLDSFEDHTSEAYVFCSSILRSGTATQTATYTARETTTTKTTVYTTLYPPTAPSSTPRPPTSTPRPPTSTPRPPTSTPRPSSTPIPSSTPRPSSSPRPSSTLLPPSSTPKPPSSTVPISSPTPTPSAACGLVGYTKTVAAYYFDSTGTKNTWAACSAACKADARCLSFGYGEANCLLFDVSSVDNVNYNPMSPYTFYDSSCPAELPVRKRQINISIGLPGGNRGITSACSCLITSGPADVTRTTTRTVTSVRVTTTQTVTRTVSLLPEDMM